MPSVVQINISANRGSTGKIANEIGKLVLGEGWESYLAYGGTHRPSESKLIQIGNKNDIYCHALQSRLFDNHGLASKRATRRFVEQLKEIKPDIVHLHNIHDYYLNYPVLFQYLQETGIPVVWTLHDCWPFTGHCAHFDHIGCQKWQTECNQCEGLSLYPKSWGLDRSKRNFYEKRHYFTSVIDRLTLVPVSHWIESFVSKSFLKEARIQTIHNGIDIQTFAPQPVADIRNKYQLEGKFVILGVASPWTPTKGLADMIKLFDMLSKDSFAIFLVGLSEKQLGQLPEGIIGITRTDSPQELAAIYSMADVFFNPTYEDNYPTTNLESIACGTPVVCYDTGGCKEAVTKDVGFIVEQGDLQQVTSIIQQLQKTETNKYSDVCRRHAEQYFDGKKAFAEYIKIYRQLL